MCVWWCVCIDRGIKTYPLDGVFTVYGSRRK